MNKSNIESIVISKDNYYENGTKQSVETSIVINRIGNLPENIHFRSFDEISEFHRVLTEYINEHKQYITG